MPMSKPQFTLSELSDYLQARFVGEATATVTSIAPIQSAVGGQICFLDNPRFHKYLKNTKATIVILAAAELPLCPTNALIVDNPYYAYARVAQLFAPKISKVSGIHPTAIIGQDCEIDPSASIGPQVVIGDRVKIGKEVVIEAHCVIGDDSAIGEDSYLYAQVTLYHQVFLGKRNIIHSGTVIGSDGFGFAKYQGHWHKVPQMGGVVIGNDVEIGANTTIDRGALKDTIIDDDVKLDNQLQIAHNVIIGKHTAIAGCVGIAGSTVIGRDCLIGGGVGIAGHIQIADNVAITAMSGVSKSITDPGVYSSGIPAVPDAQWKRSVARLRQLDKMAEKIKLLENQLTELQNVLIHETETED
jgi:UDP-3-O-[3-hydroxymyristoyl] glucosamine N-acyltransferase